MKNIYLVGFMGTGKTTVGKMLASTLGVDFIETDALIEDRQGCPIPWIFQEKGEAYFRGLERHIVHEISKRSDCVVSCGGGLVCDQENLAALKSTGTVVCLTASVDTIYERTRFTRHRPLLNVDDPRQTIRQLLDKRESFYRQADYAVATDNKIPAAIVEEIIGLTGAKR